MFRQTLGLIAVSAATLFAAEHSATSQLFNGSSLAGWHGQGAAQWKAAGGAVSGSGGAGWLVLDKKYEDYLLRLSFQCDGCDAGILLRNAPTQPGASGTTGIYVPLAGS